MTPAAELLSYLKRRYYREPVLVNVSVNRVAEIMQDLKIPIGHNELCIDRDWISTEMQRNIVEPVMRTLSVITVRVFIRANGEVLLTRWGTADIVHRNGQTYPDAGALPEWLQAKLAVLQLLDPSNTTDMPGVGRRLGGNTYWVHPDKNETL